MRSLIARTIAAFAVAAVAATPAVAATKPKVDADSFTFVATPAGVGDKYDHITLSFQLNTKKVLTRNVKVTVDGHKAARVTRFSHDKTYTAWLKESVRLSWNTTYTVTVKLNNGKTQRFRAFLEEPGL